MLDWMQTQPRQTSSDCMSTLGTWAEKCWGFPRKDHSQPLSEHWDLKAGNPSGNSDTSYSNGSDAIWYSVGPGLVTVHLPTDVALISLPNHLCPPDPVMGVHVWLSSSCSPSGFSGKEPTGQYRRHKRCQFDPWVGKIPWRRVWQLTPVFLPGESRGQRSLAGYGPWGSKESDTTEATWHGD